MPEEPSHAPREVRRPLPRNVKLLGWASCLNDVGSEMIFPLLPEFLLKVLGGTLFQLGIIEGVADSASSLLKLWSGSWSDRTGGRKSYVVWGYGIAVVARPVLYFAVHPWQLFAVRIADRVGKGVRTSPRDALIADSTDPASRGRAFGFQRGMDHLGAAAGPLLAAAFLWQWPEHLRMLFLLAFLPASLVLVLLLVGLREPPRREKAAPPPRLTLEPIGGEFRRYLLALVVFTLGNSSDVFLLVRASELGVKEWLLPVVWCAFHVVKSGGNMIAGGWVDRFGARRMILVGWVLYAAVYLAFGWAEAAWHAWALFLVYAVFYALTEPAEKTFVANLVRSDRRGLAYGWYNFSMGIAALPASVLFGLLYYQWGAMAAFGWGALLALVATAILLAGTRATRHRDGDEKNFEKG